MNKVLLEDVEDIINRFSEKWERLTRKTVLITGATGLIGSLSARVLMELNEKQNAEIKIILVARSKEKIEKLFENGVSGSVMVYEQKDITESINITEKIDYIIHTASPANARYYIEKPVETIDAIFNGSREVFELAKKSGVRKVVSLSSMEAYGTKNAEMKEEDQGFVDIYNARSSYPIGKRAAEFCGFAYYKEYGVPVISLRLAMCFGAGQRADDPRVHKAFCDAGLRGENIEVKSTGKATVNFVYAADAILAIFNLLLDGESGTVYNVAGDAKDYTIMDMAEYVANLTGVKVEHHLASGVAFAPDSQMTLNTDRIKSLGWKPKYNIEQALERYLEYLRAD